MTVRRSASGAAVLLCGLLAGDSSMLASGHGPVFGKVSSRATLHVLA